MTRVMQVLAGAPQGGAEMHFVRLALACQRAGMTQRILMRPHPELLRPLKEAGAAVVPAPFGGPFDLKTPGVLRREIADFKPEVVLSYMQRASAAVPKGIFCHIGRLGGYYDLKYFRKCDHLVVITPDLAEHCIAQGWPRPRVHVIPNFVEDQDPQPFDRAALDTPPDAPLVFALGRLHENKAFDTLLRALAALPGAYLWLAGEGPERETLAALASELGISERVRFLGWQWDPWPYFAAANLYLVPSRHEPLGSVVLEGWMMQRPMVAAASQGPAWLIDDGQDGLLVPIDEPPAMAAAMTRLLEDPALAARLAARGRARFEAEFTEAAIIRQYRNLFDELVSAKASGN